MMNEDFDDDDDGDLDQVQEIQDVLEEHLLPALDELELKFEGGAYFGMFVNCIHVLFQQGWTREELLEEIEEHFQIHVGENEGELH